MSEDFLSQAAKHVGHLNSIVQAAATPIKTDKRAVTKIGLIRARNNDLWMKLLEIALETAPNETKEVLRQINANDREISGLLTELAK